MPTIHYCNTNYNTSPPTDINPLLLQRYKASHILVLCAREQMVDRINEMIGLRETPTDQNICPIGWWDLDSEETSIEDFDVVIIVGKTRIDERFHEMLKVIEKKCSIYRRTKS